LDLRARRIVAGFLSGMHKSPYKGCSVEFATHRPYVPGDDLRHIDWRVYGRADRFYIKEHDVETNMRVNLLLDGSASMGYPEHGELDHAVAGRMTKWDYAATAAASLAYLLVSQQDAVGLTLFDSELVQQLPASTRSASLPVLSRCIENHTPSIRPLRDPPLRDPSLRDPSLRDESLRDESLRDESNIEMLFNSIAGRIPKRGMIVLLSDLLMDVDGLIAALERFVFNQQDVLVLHVLDRDELEFPFAQRTLFEGLEEPDLHVLTDPQSLRSSYLTAMNEFRSKVESACLDHRIDYALFNTADPLDVVLARFLARRKSMLRART